MTYLILIVGILIMAFNLYATVRVFKSHIYDSKQKKWQAFFIWLMPILGGAFALHFLNESKSVPGPSRSDNEMEVSDLFVPDEHRGHGDHLDFGHE